MVSGVKYVVCPLVVATPAAQSLCSKLSATPLLVVQLATSFTRTSNSMQSVPVLSAGEIDYLFVKSSTGRVNVTSSGVRGQMNEDDGRREFYLSGSPSFSAWLCIDVDLPYQAEM